MRRKRHPGKQFRLRRFGAVVALLGLVFASTIASLSHSLAMPAGHAAVMQQSGNHDHEAGHASTYETHCDGAAEKPAQHQAPMPCENGCLLCKDCSLGSFVLMPAGADPGDIGLGRHEPASQPALQALTPSPPAEPPRV